jgi:integrase/recombinase XerD
VPHLAEARVEEPANGEQDHGHDHRKPPGGALLVLELPTIGHVIARRQSDLALDGPLDVGREAAEIATAHVRLHHDVALAPFVVDDFGAFDGAKPSDLGERSLDITARPWITRAGGQRRWMPNLEMKRASLGANMARVERPGEERKPIRFYEADTVERIVAAQPTAGRRALFALLYSTGIEVGTALRLTRADVWDASQEIRAAGTKTHTRDRVASVSDWAWPLVREYMRPLLPGAPLFPGYRVDVVWHWHRESTRALGLTEHLRVHAARHHWAVLALRAGVPVRVVQLQLGHATPTLTIGLYGAFLPSGEDRAAWRARVTSHEAHRREAQ